MKIEVSSLFLIFCIIIASYEVFFFLKTKKAESLVYYMYVLYSFVIIIKKKKVSVCLYTAWNLLLLGIF